MRFTRCLVSILKLTVSAKVIFLVSCLTITTWIQYAENNDSLNETFIRELIKNASQDSQYSEVHRKKSRPRDKLGTLKYILLWNLQDWAPLYYFENGQWSFTRNNCSATNCYVTADREFFGSDLTKFDAIAFNGRGINITDLPDHRSIHQKYIYFNLESADDFPACSEHFDNFFNWTVTYKLDSDIPFPYILIRNRTGDIVGPKVRMHWVDMPEIYDYSSGPVTKTKAAAWFVSRCSTRSRRRELVMKLNEALAHYGHTVDAFGSCGLRECPLHEQSYCNIILEREYFFYMSLESSFAEDYVTEKLLTALQNDVLPIVYGGADYTRFLPPGAYLDARKFNISELAGYMNKLIHSYKQYREYFRWKHHYTYSDPKAVENVCAFCTALNDKEKFQTKTEYSDFRKWWNPDYAQRC